VPLLAIESTCDETAAAVIDRSRRVLSSVVASQEALHARWRGVVPELAARAHVERVVPVIDEALERSGVERRAIEAVAVAVRPGLVGSLLVGLAAAKGIATTLGCPLVGYDHVAAHLYACRLAHGDRLTYPCAGLVVSGGHTSLFHVRSPLDLERLGGTIDDAAGEAFDKAASLLGLGYPGGPAVERAAATGDARAFRFPRPLAGDHARLDMSFSGLKTALRYRIRSPGAPDDVPPPEGRLRADLAASFQQAVVEILVGAARRAVRATGTTRLVLSGGASANGALRAAMAEMAGEEGAELLVPPLARCTDNASMIAYAGWLRLARGEHDPLDLNAEAEMPLGPRIALESLDA